MKCYWCQSDYQDYGAYIHAESRNQARYIWAQSDPDSGNCGAEYKDVRALREPDFDNRPLEGPWLDFCPCETCKAERVKKGILYET